MADKPNLYDPRCDLPYYGPAKTNGLLHWYEEKLPSGEIKRWPLVVLPQPVDHEQRYLAPVNFRRCQGLGGRGNMR